jgi:hypothetical protein
MVRYGVSLAQVCKKLPLKNIVYLLGRLFDINSVLSIKTKRLFQGVKRKNKPELLV